MVNEFVLDSNIFIRFLTQDVNDQYKKSKEYLEKIEHGEIKGLVSILVINEIIWILENYYRLKRKDYVPELLKILTLKNIRFIEIKKSLLIKVLESSITQKFDFTDLYLFHASANKKILSFDKDFEKIV